MECTDFLEFQDYLKKSRDVDDKLIYMLNTTLPTDSFRTEMNLTSRCQDLYNQLSSNYKVRENLIKKCISERTYHIKNLQSQQKNNENSNVLKVIKKEQKVMKLLQTELGVEEVVKDRSLRLYYERCRSFYKPENYSF